MTTKSSGGKITGLLALTMEAQEALDVGDWVQVSDDYEVELADGTKPTLGKCSVSNKKRINTQYGTSVGNPNVPGDVTIEALGLWVSTEVAAATIAAGDRVSISADGMVPYGPVSSDEVSRLTITATGGTYTITYSGQTTSALAYNAAAATIQTALEALSNVGVGDLVVSGTGTTRTITAAATLADANLTDLTVDDALATGGDVTVATITQGSAAGELNAVGIALTGAAEGDTFDLLAG